MLCTIVKTILFLSNVTADYPDLPCSHIRAVLIYNEALASNCILWGVKAEELTLKIRYDPYKLRVMENV
jgi:hypothetical protein